MPRIAAFDATSAFGSIALLENGRLIEETEMHSPDGFSHIVFDQFRAILDRHAWPLDSIDCFAGAAGPGSFTGVRVCLSAVQGLAESCGKTVFGVSNLQAVASMGTAAIRAPWLDARRGEIYGGTYSANLTELSPEVVISMEQWKAQLPPGAEIIAGDRRALAAAVARIAERRFLAGERNDPATLDANYVRRSDAELFWSEV